MKPVIAETWISMTVQTRYGKMEVLISTKCKYVGDEVVQKTVDDSINKWLKSQPGTTVLQYTVKRMTVKVV